MKLPCARMDEGGRTCLVVGQSQTGGFDFEWRCIVMGDGRLVITPLSTKQLETRFPIDLEVFNGMNHLNHTKETAEQYLIKMAYSGGSAAAYEALVRIHKPTPTLAAKIEARLAAS